MTRHYHFPHGPSYRFETRELAERFRRHWPGHCGNVVPVAADPFNPPVWRIRPFVDGIALTVENRTEPVHYI